MKKGDIIVVPTDTVYGLAACLYDDQALEKIYEIKGREQSKQIAILCANIDQLNGIVQIDDASRALMETLWPGSLTIVMKTTEQHKQKTGEETIAVRMPNHRYLLNLIEVRGVLRVTSLNKSGELPLQHIKDIHSHYGDLVSEIHTQDETGASNIASTVVDVTTGKVKMIRQGSITVDDINKVIIGASSKKDD